MKKFILTLLLICLASSVFGAEQISTVTRKGDLWLNMTDDQKGIYLSGLIDGWYRSLDLQVAPIIKKTWGCLPQGVSLQDIKNAVNNGATAIQKPENINLDIFILGVIAKQYCP